MLSQNPKGIGKVSAVYTAEFILALVDFGKGKILFHQGKDEFVCVNCAYLADAFWVLGQRPDY